MNNWDSLKTKLYDKSLDFDFPIVNILYICCMISASPLNEIYKYRCGSRLLENRMACCMDLLIHQFSQFLMEIQTKIQPKHFLFYLFCNSKRSGTPAPWIRPWCITNELILYSSVFASYSDYSAASKQKTHETSFLVERFKSSLWKFFGHHLVCTYLMLWKCWLTTGNFSLT